MQALSKGVKNKEFGSEGEGLAARYLERLGFRILERNYRCRLGEIDLIVEKGGTISFVEVKSRHSTDQVRPTELISLNKQRHISKVAQHYMASKRLFDTAADFAVLAVDWSQGEPQLELIEGAFSLAWGY